MKVANITDDPSAGACPQTHDVDCEEARRTLDYTDMVALAELYRDWALHEEKITDEQRARLMLWSADYECIAEFSGPSWTALDPDTPPGPAVFIARQFRART